MSILVGTQLAQHYGALEVFANVQLRIEHDDRIGLVGPNGAGKTSLLRILAGVDPSAAGSLDFAAGIRVGYLPQDPPLAGECTLYADLLSVFQPLLAQREELRALERRMDAADLADGQLEQLLDQYGHLQEAFEAAGGYSLEQRVKQVLTGLGFPPATWSAPLAHLSGGQRTRALLGRLLLEEADLLLLDEPTNHLDIRAVEWLEQALQSWPGSVVVVSHDRYFLDAVTNRTWEMNHGRLEVYRGNYSHYRQQREERLQRWQVEYEKQQKFIQETQEFVRRYKAGQRTKEAQGRETRLQRFLAEEALPPPPSERRIRLPLNASSRSGDLVLRTRKLVIGYDGEPLLMLPDLELRRREIVALLGPNGAGKTTLIKTILGELSPVAGRCELGAGVQIGYLAQRHVGAGFGLMDPAQTVLEALLEIKNLPIAQARNYLAQFLFQGDDVFQTIDSLSGGQRSRIALARLTLQGANFLLLDEPTNHLDLDSQEILQDVIQQFSGTVLLVTHDRALVDGVATRLWLVEPGSGGQPGELAPFKGSWRQWLLERATVGQSAEAPGPAVQAPTEAQTHREQQREERRLRQATERRQAEARALEERIHQMERQLAELEEAMATAGQAQELETLRRLSGQHQTLSIRLEEAMGAWAALAETAAVVQ